MKIDFVVPWVDSSDPKWQEQFSFYRANAGFETDFTDKRYRDWGLFKYWFRGVEKYAPWVNKVHLITCGHYPKWLNLEHPKLNLVKHEDYIPKEFLPVFSANPIELNMHRIEGLTEKFVYFNDDFFIINKCSASTFFTGDMPNDAAILTAYDGMGFSRMQLNNISIINKHFVKNDVIRSKFLNWFNLKYGFNIIRTLLLSPWGGFTGIYDHHLPNSFVKATLEEVWLKEYEMLERASSNRFRNLEQDLTQYVFRFWQLASNKFNPIAKQRLGDYCPVGLWPTDKVIKRFEGSKKPFIVLNDHDPENLDEVIQKLTVIFEKKLPEKSSFEL